MCLSGPQMASELGFETNRHYHLQNRDFLGSFQQRFRKISFTIADVTFAKKIVSNYFVLNTNNITTSKFPGTLDHDGNVDVGQVASIDSRHTVG